MVTDPQKYLLGLSIQELTAIVEAPGEPHFRARQLFEGLYSQRLSELDQFTSLPKSFRQWLRGAGYAVGLPSIQRQFTSNDGTVRYLIELPDHQTIETVWMPHGDGGETGDGSDADPDSDSASGWKEGRFHRATICVSSQAGCAVNCQFCMTALLGLQRNLTAGEIIGQVLAVLNERDVNIEQERINLVFMGQGEPFLNYENFMKAVRLLVEEVGIPASRMTVSTAGIVPRIYDFAQEPVRPKLAISLNASNEAQRTDIMPITKKWTLDQLMDAARQYPLKARERVTFEYVLLNGVNDAPENAREVIELTRGIRTKIYLIALNPGPEIPFGTPAEDRV